MGNSNSNQHQNRRTSKANDDQINKARMISMNKGHNYESFGCADPECILLSDHKTEFDTMTFDQASNHGHKYSTVYGAARFSANENQIIEYRLKINQLSGDIGIGISASNVYTQGDITKLSKECFYTFWSHANPKNDKSNKKSKGRFKRSVKGASIPIEYKPDKFKTGDIITMTLYLREKKKYGMLVYAINDQFPAAGYFSDVVRSNMVYYLCVCCK